MKTKIYPLIGLGLFLALTSDARVITSPAPKDRALSADYEVIADGHDLYSDELELSFLKFMEQANATKDPSSLQLLQSKYLIEATNFLQSCAARKGARKPDPKHIAAARSSAGGKVVPMANRKNPPRQQFPVF